ncbi:MAG: hypothetical protein QXM73_03150 [Candidatus Nezhaarchaeales archaeon]
MLKELSIDDVILLKTMSEWNRIATRELMSAVNFKRTKFYNCINRLMKLGLVVRVLTGEYQLTDQGRLLAEKLMDPRDAARILSGSGEPLKLKKSNSEVEIRNLNDLKNFVGEVESEDLYWHVRTSNFSRWLYMIGDRYLSRELSKFRTTITKNNVKEKMKELVEERVNFLNELVSLTTTPRRGRAVRRR